MEKGLTKANNLTTDFLMWSYEFLIKPNFTFNY